MVALPLCSRRRETASETIIYPAPRLDYDVIHILKPNRFRERGLRKLALVEG